MLVIKLRYRNIGRQIFIYTCFSVRRAFHFVSCMINQVVTVRDDFEVYSGTLKFLSEFSDL